MIPGSSPAVARSTRFFVIGLLLAAAQFTQNPAQAAKPAAVPATPTKAALIKPNSPEFRGLMIKTAKPGRYVPAPLLATEVEIEVTGPVARTRVRQHYLNPSKSWIEGVYVFPLADKSAVDVLRMRIGDRLVEGVIKERAQARKIYEAAKAKGKHAALVESHRPNVFMSNVANIGPGENITIEIAYQKTIPIRDGEFRLRFPMVVGPRYFPKGQAGVVLAGGAVKAKAEAAAAAAAKDKENMTSPVIPPEGGKINPLTITVRINGAGDTAALKSHHHRVNIARAEDGTRVVKLANGPVPADRDFELTWSAGNESATALLFTEQWQGRHYGLVMVAPPRNHDKDIITSGREIVFVMDTSGSMAGRSIIQAKASLKFALGRLRPADKFNVIQFNSSTDALFDRVVTASTRNKLMAMAYVGALKANGGTEMRGALLQALDANTDPRRLRQVVFMTDGAVGNESRLFGTITRRLGDARLFTVGIGSAPNRYFMRGAARRGRGTFTFIGSPNQVTPRMGALWTKLAKPVVTHLSVGPVKETTMEVWPDLVPDLFAGEPVFFAIRFAGLPTDVRVTGKSATGPWQKRLAFASAPKGSGIAKLWAREKIAGLQSLKYLGVPAEEVRARMLKVALAHGLVTRHTSLVAVDKAVARDGTVPLATKKLPHNLPHGWEYDKVFGKRPSPAAFGPRKAMLDKARRSFKMAAVAKHPAPASMAASTKLQLPQTATPQTIFLIIGLMSLLAGFLVILMGRGRCSHG
jgi:Ca-activated chloride channel family protein